MKDFKCKAKRKDNSEWVYGYVDETMYHDLTVIHTDGGGTHEVIRDTVCFSTGMCDNEGRMIYEGDIIGYKGKAIEYVVFYNKKMAAYFVMNPETEDIKALCHTDDCKVIIGNIYGNEEGGSDGR